MLQIGQIGVYILKGESGGFFRYWRQTATYCPK
jgi:hypothetical protein